MSIVTIGNVQTFLYCYLYYFCPRDELDIHAFLVVATQKSVLFMRWLSRVLEQSLTKNIL